MILSSYGSSTKSSGKVKLDRDITTLLEGKYLVPGFFDGHIHLENSMVTPELHTDPNAIAPANILALLIFHLIFHHVF